MSAAAPFFSLPRTISPREFFENYVASELRQVPVPAHATNQRSAITLSGPSGGTWTFGQTAGVADVQAGAAGQAPIHVSLSEAHWRELLFGSVRDRLLDALGGRAVADQHWRPSRLSALFMPERQLARLAASHGVLAVAIEDDEEGDVYQIALGLGGAAPEFGRAKATLELDLDTWIELAQRKVQPQQAMMQGKILIKGDMAYPMGILSNLMAPQ